MEGLRKARLIMAPIFNPSRQPGLASLGCAIVSSQQQGRKDIMGNIERPGSFFVPALQKEERPARLVWVRQIARRGQDQSGEELGGTWRVEKAKSHGISRGSLVLRCFPPRRGRASSAAMLTALKASRAERRHLAKLLKVA